MKSYLIPSLIFIIISATLFANAETIWNTSPNAITVLEKLYFPMAVAALVAIETLLVNSWRQSAAPGRKILFFLLGTSAVAFGGSLYATIPIATFQEFDVTEERAIVVLVIASIFTAAVAVAIVTCLVAAAAPSSALVMTNDANPE